MFNNFLFAVLALFAIEPSYAENSSLGLLGINNSKLSFTGYNEKFGGWSEVEFKNSKAEFKIYAIPTKADNLEEGVVASSDVSMMSPQKKYLIVQRTNAGEVIDGDGNKKISSQAYCDVISLETGCVKNIGSVQQCDGAWQDERWKDSTGDVFDAATGGVPPSRLISNVAGVTGSESRASTLKDYVFMGVPSYMACYPPEKSIPAYNDVAFYFAQGGEHLLAMQIYERLLPLAANRVPLKLNVADSLWALGKHEEAMGYYVDYRSAMAKKGLLGKMPARVAERLK
ncbi:tetratricopeptide repeat protein [Pseudomonas sp. Sample_23]|jgi:hypothetical protein|uniref:tetratricopeptide repeat protein n=1 Tax=Pseudomonas sp. Sample_23 TaxID=2448267 RepID=UPI0010329F8D|nr:tetratricopeptide repeat protein [Pseudomonas sp. Sample_23]